MVAVNITLHNSGEKSLWIHDIKAKITTDGGEFTDEAASAVDFDRYFQAFPALKEHAILRFRRRPRSLPAARPRAR